MIRNRNSSLDPWSPMLVTIGAMVLATLVGCSDGNGGSGGSSGGSGGTGTGGTVGSGGNTSGGSQSGDCSVSPPAGWTAPNWETNTEEALALRERLPALSGSALMRGGETGDLTVVLADLTTAYTAGTPSLKSISSTSLVSVIEDAFEEYLAALAAGTQDLVDGNGDWVPGEEGGVWSSNTRAFNEGGIEVRQIVDKGLFGGAFYNYALSLTTGSIDEATIDAMAAIFGANPDLNPGRNDDAVDANQNVVSANYVYRMGFYAEAKQALIDAKAYAGAEACGTERDAAIQSFFRAWEQGLFARFLFYSNNGATAVDTALDDDALATALHDQAEGLGLVVGFYGIQNPASGPMSSSARLMTDARIAEALTPLGVDVSGDLGDATLGEFVANPAGYASAVGEVEDVIAEVFGLSETDLASYRTPTDG